MKKLLHNCWHSFEKTIIYIFIWTVETLILLSRLNSFCQIVKLISFYQGKGICDSTYQKVPVVRRLDFKLQGCKVLKIWSYGQFWNITYFGIFNTLLFKLLKGFDVNTVFSYKNGLFQLLVSCCMPMLCTDSQTFKSLFLKINFSPIGHDVVNEITISGEHSIHFNNFCTKIELKEQPFR